MIKEIERIYSERQLRVETKLYNVEAEGGRRGRSLAQDFERPRRPAGLGVRPPPRHPRGAQPGRWSSPELRRPPVREEAQLRSADADAGTESSIFCFVGYWINFFFFFSRKVFSREKNWVHWKIGCWIVTFFGSVFWGFDPEKGRVWK